MKWFYIIMLCFISCNTCQKVDRLEQKVFLLELKAK